MKLGVIKTIVKEELSKFEELPKWMDPFLQTLNTFISNVATSLKGNLTFEDNFLCKKRTLKVSHGVEAQINPDSRLKVTGVACFNTNGATLDKFSWRVLSSGNVGVTFYFDPSTDATCDIIIFLG